MANYDGKTLVHEKLDLYYESAKNITVGTGGNLFVNKGASVTGTTVNNGYMLVYDHGKAKGTVINDGGSVEAAKADLLEDTVINSGGKLYFENYLIKNTTVNAGGVLICEGEEASATTVNRGGTMKFNSDYAVKLSGRTVFGGNIVTGYTEAISVSGELVFAVNQRETGDKAIIDNFAVFRSGSYSVTVKADQQEGQYCLAGNAAGFNASITVKDTSYKKLGALSVGGSFSSKGYTYSLLLDKGTLVLNVVGNGGGGSWQEEPAAVTGLRCKVNKYNVSLGWDKSAAKNSTFEISIDGELVASTKSNNYTLKNFAIGDHQVKVRMMTANGTAGDWSETALFTVADITAPTLGKVTATIDGYTGTVTWSGSDNVGIVRYEVRCADQVQTVAGTSAAFDNLAVGKYNAEVIAYDAAGNISKTGKTKVTVKDVTPPEQVTGLVVPVTDAKYKATLSWGSGVDNSGKVASYEIQLDGGKILKSSKTTLSVSKLSVGEHAYKVRAIDKDKNVGEWSGIQTFTVQDMTAPGNVSVKAKVEGNSLLLTWKTPKDNVSVTGYILKHGVNLECSEFLAAGELNFRIDGIAKGSYQYQVIAVDAAGNESKAKTGKATIKTELLLTELNLELPDATSLLAFDSGMQTAVPETIIDSLAFCSYLKLESALNLSAADLIGQDETGKQPAPLFAVAS